MLHKHRAGLILLAVSGCLAATHVEGQEPPGPVELAAGLRAQVEERGSMYYVVQALVQYWRPHHIEELDALADSVVEIAVDYTERGVEGAVALQGNALGVLRTAMRWNNPYRGEPYRGAEERIITLVYRTQGLVGHAGLLVTLARLEDRDEGLRHLRFFAMSSHHTAEVAVRLLAREDLGGPEGLAILRELHDADLVTEPRATWQIEALGRARGWR